MGAETGIEWTDATWNPTRGCSRISPGCENCYAEVMAGRFSQPGFWGHGFALKIAGQKARWTRNVALIHDKLDLPLTWRDPRRIFVNSTSDLFHERLANEEIAAVFGVMAVAPQHTFQILTKRSARMREWFKWVAAQERDPADFCIVAAAGLMNSERAGERWEKVIEDANLGAAHTDAPPWPLENVWLGVSVESQEYADERIPHLIETPSAVRFLSCEPLLGPLALSKWLDPWTCSGCEFHGAEGDSGKCVCANCSVDAVYSEALGSYQCPRCRKDDSTSSSVGDTCPRCGSVEEWGRDYGFKFDSDRRLIDWAIVGGESSHGARPMHLDWARSIVGQCKAAGVAVFVKQLGAWPAITEEQWRWFASQGLPTPLLNAKGEAHVPPGYLALAMSDGHGSAIEEFPPDLQVRQFPEARHG